MEKTLTRSGMTVTPGPLSTTKLEKVRFSLTVGPATAHGSRWDS